MAQNQKKYDTEYKVQIVKLSKEIVSGAHTPETAMSLAEEFSALHKRVKEQEKKIR